MGYIEIHSHLLPFVDDGVGSKEQCSKVLAAYQAAGFDRIVFTPHLYNPYVTTRVQNIRPMFMWASEEAAKYGLAAYLGGETYVGSSDNLNALPFLGQYVLLEVNYIVEPLFLLNQAYTLLKRGFEVILAHVERYQWFKDDSLVAQKLLEMGVHFQCNVDGVESGLATRWIEKGLIDVIAGDNHGDAGIPARLANLYVNYPEVLGRMDSLVQGMEKQK
ncbi:MAG: CpsB/CapC family capsule biosynthesis tyrosine phosphatase [Sphaerochaetaceae bacterium]